MQLAKEPYLQYKFTELQSVIKVIGTASSPPPIQCCVEL